MESKYLGTKVNGWKVVSMEPAPGNHYIYTLQRKKGFVIKKMTVRDNELTKFSRGKTIDSEIYGKGYQINKNIRLPQNTIGSKFSLLNLFKTI